MVRIGGAAPSKVDARLGSIVIGMRAMQYDFEQATLGVNPELIRSPVTLKFSLLVAIMTIWTPSIDNKIASRIQSQQIILHTIHTSLVVPFGVSIPVIYEPPITPSN